MEWEAGALPYCGVWIDEGVLNQVSAVAIEPCSGYYDSLVAAWQNGRVAEVGPGETRTWRLDVTLNGVV
jgi:hypothetical protein